MTEDKFCIFVVDSYPNEVEWASTARSLLQKHFSDNGFEAVFTGQNLKHNTRGAHPSWYKTLAHRHTDYKYDFILCWDLDLIPCKSDSVSIVFDEVDTKKFYSCPDTILFERGCLSSNEKYTRMDCSDCSKFRWNCGLLGIPKSHASTLEKMYDDNCNSTRHSWEQYYINDYLSANEHLIVDGNYMNNILSFRYPNFLVDGDIVNIHYSAGDSLRQGMIKNHCYLKGIPEC